MRPEDPPDRAGAVEAGRSGELGWLRERTDPPERDAGAGAEAGGLTRDGLEDRGVCDQPPDRGEGIDAPGDAGAGSRER